MGVPARVTVKFTRVTRQDAFGLGQQDAVKAQCEWNNCTYWKVSQKATLQKTQHLQWADQCGLTARPARGPERQTLDGIAVAGTKVQSEALPQDSA